MTRISVGYYCMAYLEGPGVHVLPAIIPFPMSILFTSYSVFKAAHNDRGAVWD
jgi:hypothetical protein